MGPSIRAASQGPRRPYEYSPIELNRDGHGLCFICRLTSWARGEFWENSGAVRDEQGRGYARPCCAIARRRVSEQVGAETARMRATEGVVSAGTLSSLPRSGLVQLRTRNPSGAPRRPAAIAVRIDLALAGNIGRNHSTSSGSEQAPRVHRARRASTPTRDWPSARVVLGSIPRSPKTSGCLLSQTSGCLLSQTSGCLLSCVPRMDVRHNQISTAVL